MFGIGIMEIVVVAVVLLLFVGPRRLPQTMHQLGKIFVRVRRVSSEAKSTFDNIIRTAEQEVDKEIAEKTAEKIRQELLPVAEQDSETTTETTNNKPNA